MSTLTAATGPLTRRVLGYERVMRELVPRAQSPSDWDPLKEFVAVESFTRVGTFMEVQDWQQYTVMLTRWASSIDSFETKVQRTAELSNLVYYEIEERHHRQDSVHVVRSMTVFAFDANAKISQLDVYLQQPRP